MNSNRKAVTPVAPWRKYALAAGLLYLLTFVSIPTLFLYVPIHDPNFMVGSGPDTPVLIGAVLEIIVALAGIGTAVALYPVVKRQNESLALGFVASRTLEAAAIFGGVVCLLSTVALRQAGAGADGLATGRALVILYDRFFLGQNLMPVMNALLLGTLLYRSRLVPRALPTLGLIGAPILLASLIAALFGLTGEVSTGRLLGILGLGAMPIALWEFSLGVWLTVKGFNSSAIVFQSARAVTSEQVLSAV